MPYGKHDPLHSRDWGLAPPALGSGKDASLHRAAAPGRLLGRIESLGFDLEEKAVLQSLTQDIVESSRIKGELLGKEQVRSSLARRLGMDAYALVPANRTVEGVVEMMLDAIRLYGEPLTKERLLGRQAALFSTGHEEAEDRV